MFYALSNFHRLYCVSSKPRHESVKALDDASRVSLLRQFALESTEIHSYVITQIEIHV